MTVAELITLLQAMPQDARVLQASEVAFSEVIAVRRRRFYVTGEGTQGGWRGPFETTRDDDTDTDTFEGVEIDVNEWAL